MVCRRAWLKHTNPFPSEDMSFRQGHSAARSVSEDHIARVVPNRSRQSQQNNPTLWKVDGTIPATLPLLTRKGTQTSTTPMNWPDLVSQI